MIDKYDEMIAACLETPEVRQNMRGSIVQHPSQLNDGDLHHDRDRWIMVYAILDVLRSQVPDRPAHQPRGTIPIDMLSRASPHAANSCPGDDVVTALSLAVNEALQGSPRRIERFLPSDPTTEKLLRARGAANEIAKEPAQLYLWFLYAAMLTWAAARETTTWSVRQRSLTPLAKWRFARVRQYIDLHIEEPIHLQDLAKVAGLSRMHFAAQFREYTGISPCKFVTMKRIQHAKMLLSDPRRTVADVAFSVGFRTQAHFTTVFHRFVGSTPNCWRKALCQKDASLGPVEIAEQKTRLHRA
jgi:AraC-like DNA-binding protein